MKSMRSSRLEGGDQPIAPVAARAQAVGEQPRAPIVKVTVGFPGIAEAAVQMRILLCRGFIGIGSSYLDLREHIGELVFNRLIGAHQASEGPPLQAIGK